MKITCLMENTCNIEGLSYEHGLSFLVETPKHKILADTGASCKFLDNAHSLGIDLRQVDTVFLSHGHYDHCGGLLGFCRLNSKALVYIHDGADGDYYHGYDRYIGIDKNIMDLPQLQKGSGVRVIDSELCIFDDARPAVLCPATNDELKEKKDNEFSADDFAHEQYLEIFSEGKRVLISGCAHKGIVNIMARYRSLRGVDPDVVISGLHTVNKNGYSEEEVRLIEDIGKELKKYKTIFYTCHCTGDRPYEILKNIMGDQIHYIGTGEIIEIK